MKALYLGLGFAMGGLKRLCRGPDVSHFCFEAFHIPLPPHHSTLRGRKLVLEALGFSLSLAGGLLEAIDLVGEGLKGKVGLRLSARQAWGVPRLPTRRGTPGLVLDRARP